MILEIESKFQRLKKIQTEIRICVFFINLLLSIGIKSFAQFSLLSKIENFMKFLIQGTTYHFIL